ncbi:MAG: hypothetical protein AAGF94_15720 [Pseudomonadota bacterium]
MRWEVKGGPFEAVGGNLGGTVSGIFVSNVDTNTYRIVDVTVDGVTQPGFNGTWTFVWFDAPNIYAPSVSRLTLSPIPPNFVTGF